MKQPCCGRFTWRLLPHPLPPEKDDALAPGPAPAAPCDGRSHRGTTVTAAQFDAYPKAVYEASKHAPVTVLDSQGRPSMTVVQPTVEDRPSDGSHDERWPFAKCIHCGHQLPNPEQAGLDSIPNPEQAGLDSTLCPKKGGHCERKRTANPSPRPALCEDHALQDAEHCEMIEAMLRQVPERFLAGEGDTPAEAIERWRQAWDEEQMAEPLTAAATAAHEAWLLSDGKYDGALREAMARLGALVEPDSDLRVERDT